MRFFKYLVFIFIFISTYTHSQYSINGDYPSSSAIETCQKYISTIASKPKVDRIEQIDSTRFICHFGGDSTITINYIPSPSVCPLSGYPLITYFESGTPAPTQVCKQNSDGTFCPYNYGGSSSPKNPLIITSGSHQQIILNSVSSIPSSSCTPKFHKTSCDPKDPYAGCYQPPDDGCNRMSDGSIYCPPDVPTPEPTKGCNGDTYCDRPPQGCGEGYVSGSFNGKQICIKTSPSTDNPPSPNEGDTGNTGEGTGTSTTTGTQTTTTTNSDGSTSTSTTTTNNTTVNNFKIDMSGVIAAVNAVSAQVSSLKNELLTSLTDLSNKLGLTNSKLDTTNQKLNEINDSSLRQEQLLKDIRDKTVSDGGSDQPASGASTDLTETNGILNEIKDWLTEEVKDYLPPVETPFKNLEQKDINSNLYKITGQCPVPKTFYIPVVGHTFQLDLIKFCNVLSIIGILVSIAACLHGVAILSENT